MYSDNIKYIGCDDAGLDLFESQYALQDGMCYNSFVILDRKVAVMDSSDPRTSEQWLYNLNAALDGRKPDYIIVQHMEPDHSGSLSAFRKLYPEAVIVASAKAIAFMQQFDEDMQVEPVLAVKEGDILDLGERKLQFIAAPMEIGRASCRERV